MTFRQTATFCGGSRGRAYVGRGVCPTTQSAWEPVHEAWYPLVEQLSSFISWPSPMSVSTMQQDK